MFFVDDLKVNVDAAVTAGWQAFHFTPESRDTLIAKLQP
jgi:FMN phosphatase YigB (HAD superfamily)